MTTAITNNFDGGANGVDITSSNTGGVSGTPIASAPFNTPATLRFSALRSVSGGLSLEIYRPATKAAYALWNASTAVGTRFVTRIYAYFPSAYPRDAFLEFRNAASTRIVAIGFNNDILVYYNSPGSAISTQYNPPHDTWLRFELAITIGTTTSNSQIALQVFEGHSTTPLFTGSSTTDNLGTADLAGIRVGNSAGPTADTYLYVDDFAVSELATGWIGPSVTSTIPNIKGWSYIDHGQEPSSVNTIIGASVDGSTPITSFQGTAASVGDWVIAVYTGTTSYGITAEQTGWTQLVMDYPSGGGGQPTLNANTSYGTGRFSVWGRKRQVGDPVRYRFSLENGATTSSLTLLWGSGSADITSWVTGVFAKRAGDAGLGLPAEGTNATTIAKSLNSPSNSLVLHIHSERTTATESSYTTMTGAQPLFFGAQYGSTMIQTTAIGTSSQSTSGATPQSTITWPNTQVSNGIGVQIAIPAAIAPAGIAVVSTSSYTVQTTIDANASPAVANIVAPSSLAIGHYYVVAAVFAQGTATQANAVTPPGFTLIGTNYNQPDVRMMAVFGRYIATTSDLSSAQSTPLRAGFAATRIVATGIALSNVNPDNPVSVQGATNSGLTTGSALPLSPPTSGDTILNFAYTNNSASTGVPIASVTNGSIVIQATSYASTASPSTANSTLVVANGGTALNYSPSYTNASTFGIGFRVAGNTAPSVIVKGISNAASTGLIDATATPALVNLTAPSALAIGQYYLVAVVYGQAFGENVTDALPPGFTRLYSSSGTTNARLIAIYGRKITSTSDLSSAQTTPLRAGTTATRIVGVGVALSGLRTDNPLAGKGNLVFSSSSLSGLTPEVPPNGDVHFYFAYTNNSAGTGLPNHTIPSGTKITQANSYSTGTDPQTANTALSITQDISSIGLSPNATNGGIIGLSFYNASNAAPVAARGIPAVFWTGSTYVNGAVTLLSTGGTEVVPESVEFGLKYGTVSGIMNDFAQHKTFYIAHRGGGGNWPEMSLRGYRNSALLGMTSLEVSVYKTLDGVYVGSHDSNLLRVTGQDIDIRSVNWADIQSQTVLSSTTDNASQPNQPLSRLDDILARYSHTHVIFLDDKGATNTTDILNIMDANGGPEHFVWKEYRGGTRAAQARARGYKAWGYFYPDDAQSVFDDNMSKYDFLGQQYDASQAQFDMMIATGKPVIGHIISTVAQRDMALAKGAHGIMTTKPRQTFPYY